MLYLAPRLQFETIIIQSKIHVSFHVIVAGLVILVIAEAFRIGVEMKEEQELTRCGDGINHCSKHYILLPLL